MSSVGTAFFGFVRHNNRLLFLFSFLFGTALGITTACLLLNSAAVIAHPYAICAASSWNTARCLLSLSLEPILVALFARSTLRIGVVGCLLTKGFSTVFAFCVILCADTPNAVLLVGILLRLLLTLPVLLYTADQLLNEEETADRRRDFALFGLNLLVYGAAFLSASVLR